MRVVLELSTARLHAQQRMHRAGLAHAVGQVFEVNALAQAALQTGQRLVDGLAQARRRFARGRSQGHPQLRRVGAGGQQQGQQACGSVGFAGARPACDDGQSTAQGQSASDLLPSGAWSACVMCVRELSTHQVGSARWCRGVWARVSRRRKQAVEPITGGFGVHMGQRPRPLGHGLGHLLLIDPIAAQIEQGLFRCATQHQGLPLVGGLRAVATVCTFSPHSPPCATHHRAALQSLEPGRQTLGQLSPKCAQASLHFVGPRQHRLRLQDQLTQGQTHVTAPLHVRQQGAGHQQRRRSLRIELLHKMGHGAVQASQAPLLSPGEQGAQSSRSV